MKKNQETYLKFVAEVAAKTATEQTIEIHKQLKEKEEREARDKRLRNTKLLLKNYRDFRAYIERIEGSVIENNYSLNEEASIKDLLVRGEDIVKSIKQSTQRTIMMVEYIKQSLAAFKYICEYDPYRETERQYEVLHLRYVEGFTIDAIANKYGINERSVYKAIDVAAERLSVILFGVYGLRFD